MWQLAAAATESLLLATGICLVIERDPITMAKEVASLDHLSRGRFHALAQLHECAQLGPRGRLAASRAEPGVPIGGVRLCRPGRSHVS